MKLKERLDNLMVSRGLAESRTKAQALILAGQVRVGGERRVKAGQLVSPQAEIDIDQPPEFVSRGGFKLQKALQEFGVEVAGKLALDIGSSTGGFTHCLLKYGAARVYAVDVGKAQLHPGLRNHPQVQALEGVNARYLAPGDIPEAVDIITIDVSFISLTKIIPAVRQFLKPGGILLALVKPQFEAGRYQVGRNGVVKSSEVHREVLTQVIACGSGWGLEFKALSFSPFKGPAGNIEYLAYFMNTGTANADHAASSIAQQVAEAHRNLM